MITKFHVKPLRFFPGYLAGLIDKTVLVELSWENELQDRLKEWPSFEALLSQKASTLCLSDPLPGIQQADWPDTFLLETPEPHQISHWIIALSVGLQRWACDPAWKGKVLLHENNHATLALHMKEQR